MKILYFARLREDLGCGEEDLPLPDGVDTVARLRDYLMARGGRWKESLAGKSLRIAVNQEMAQPASTVKADDEVAFFPPVTGG